MKIAIFHQISIANYFLPRGRTIAPTIWKSIYFLWTFQKWMDFIRCASRTALQAKLSGFTPRRFRCSTEATMRPMTIIFFLRESSDVCHPLNYSRNFDPTSRKFSVDLWKKVFSKHFPFKILYKSFRDSMRLWRIYKGF